MSVLDWLRGRRPAPPLHRVAGAVARWEQSVPRSGRSWLAAKPSRLLADIPGQSAYAPNRDIRWQLATLRNRSQWLAKNDGYTAGFLKALRRNVVGPNGFALQMRVMQESGAGPDTNANARIETAWKRWSRVGWCDVSGRLSWADVCGLAILGVARDGEALIRLHRNWPRNPHGFALEVIDPARLDEALNGRPDGVEGENVVRAGIERDAYGAPVAYYLWKTTPNDDPAAQRGTMRVRQRVPAEDLLHIFLPEWADQIRGVPWIANGLRALAMLDGYSEAELTAARVAAAKMGFYTMDGDAEPDGELQEDGALVQEASAGQMELLPKGVDFKAFDPQHPNAAFGDFVAAMLRGVAAGVGLSYNAFANDAEGMNYSALRATELEDRDEFRVLQHWMIGCFCEPVFTAWLREWLTSGMSGLPVTKMWKFDAPEFIARGWQWVDPLKEVAAAEKAVALGIASRTQIVAAQGGDIEAIAADLAREKDMLAGLTPAAAVSAAAPAAEDEED